MAGAACQTATAPAPSTKLGTAPLLPTLGAFQVGNLLLELCTPRAGEMEVLAGLPDDQRIGVGVVNQKLSDVEALEDVLARAEHAVQLFGAERVLLVPDCGFATFADNPISSAATAEKKLARMAEVAARLRDRHKMG